MAPRARSLWGLASLLLALAVVAAPALAASSALAAIGDDAAWDLDEGALEKLRGWLSSWSFESTPGVSATLPPVADPTRANRTSFFLPMRDGIELWTTAVVPDGLPAVGTVLFRTPYGVPTCLASAEAWVTRGFAVVCQEQRGSGRSRLQDTFKMWRMCGQDGYDTMTWIVAQPWSDGSIFPSGASALGMAAFASGLLQPPWIKAAYPWVATPYGHTTMYPGGAYRRSLGSLYLTLLGFSYAIPELLANEGKGEWWYPIDISFHDPGVCDFPGVTKGGWWDLFSQENVEGFEFLNYQATSPRCRGQMKLLMEPGGHCAGGEYTWPNMHTGASEDVAHYLFLRETGREIPPALEARFNEVNTVTLYVMGRQDTTVANYWTTLPSFPSFVPRNYYLAPNGTLQLTPPSSPSVDPLTFTYDPNDPVGTIGGNEFPLLQCGPYSQNELLGRTDILWFTAETFTTATALVGKLTAKLWVSTDRNDTDFTVKLMDLYPDGRSMLLQDGAVRLRWRNGGEVAELAVPDQIYQVDVRVQMTAYIFEPGHALRVAVSSSNHPRYERNPNNGLPMGVDGPLLIARNTVYLDANRPSHVTLPIVDLSSIPANFTP